MPVNADKVNQIAKQRQDVGVMFTPASVGHPVLYALDSESRANLLAVYVAAGAGKLPNGVTLSFKDNGQPVRALLTAQEVGQLGDKALGYVAAVSAHADALIAGQAQWTDPWPSNA